QILKHWQIGEIIERALNELILAGLNPRWRRHIEAAPKDIDWHIASGPYPSPLTIVPVIGVEFSRCRSCDQWSRAVPIKRVSESSLFPRIPIEDCNAAAPISRCLLTSRAVSQTCVALPGCGSSRLCWRRLLRTPPWRR